MLRASAAAEEAGVPSSSLVCEGFVGQAGTTSSGLGMPNLPLAMVPGHVDVQTNDELRANVLDVTVDDVIRNLTEQPLQAQAIQEPDPREILFEGTFEEVNRLFLENGWTDGLPIVPPTMDKIEEFLAFTDRLADEVIGRLLPDNREATIWNVAVNGVMAGCRPEYMPILVALAEAMTDPRYGVEHSGNTPGAETLIVLNGSLIKELNFNYEQGALRDGFQPNTAVGRFWRLYLRNVAGFLLHQNDKGTFGNTWRVVLAENEDAIRDMGWTTLSEDAGAAKGENAITISRYTGGNVIVSVFGNAAEQILPYLGDSLVKHTGWELCFTVGLATGTYQPLLVLSPVIAQVLAKSAMSKRDVQQWLFENARMTAAKFEQYIAGYTNLVPGGRSLMEMARLGQAPKVFGESDDPQRLVPVVCEPKDILIAVSGDPLRTNCYLFVHNGMLGYTTPKGIELPDGWSEKLKNARNK